MLNVSGDMTSAEITDLPIKCITDGWVLKEGMLYLFVKCPDNVIRTVQIPRKR